MSKKNYNYEFKGSEAKLAKAFLSNQRASLKYSTEFGRELKGKKLDKAQAFLMNVIEKKEFLPLRRYTKKVPHRRGDAKSFTKTGRYPQKTAKVLLKLLGLVKANADYKGLDSENLLIVHFFASQGFKRIGHQAKGAISGKRRQKQSAHLEIIVREAGK